VYGVLYEAEHRSTFYVPYWKFPPARWLVPRQVKFAADMAVINKTLTDLINQAKDTRQVRIATTDLGDGEQASSVPSCGSRFGIWPSPAQRSSIKIDAHGQCDSAVGRVLRSLRSKFPGGIS
jgi:hypothetical protein